MKLPQMQEYLGPWWPMPVANKDVWGKHREELSDDAQLHCWHGWWTYEELHQYGVLPAKPYFALPEYGSRES